MGTYACTNCLSFAGFFKDILCLVNLILEVGARRLQIANHFNQNICRSRVLVILVITQYGASGLQFQSVVPL